MFPHHSSVAFDARRFVIHVQHVSLIQRNADVARRPLVTEQDNVTTPHLRDLAPHVAHLVAVCD